MNNNNNNNNSNDRFNNRPYRGGRNRGGRYRPYYSNNRYYNKRGDVAFDFGNPAAATQTSGNGQAFSSSSNGNTQKVSYSGNGNNFRGTFGAGNPSGSVLGKDGKVRCNLYGSYGYHYGKCPKPSSNSDSGAAAAAGSGSGGAAGFNPFGFVFGKREEEMYGDFMRREPFMEDFMY